MTTVSVSPTPNGSYFDAVIDGGKSISKNVGDSIRDLVTYATHIKDDATAHTNLWKAIPAGITAAGNHSLIHGPAGASVRFLETWQLFGDIGDFLSGSLKYESWVEVAKRVFFAFSNLGTTVLTCQEYGLISLSSGITSTFSALASGGAAVGFGIIAGSGLYSLATLEPGKYSNVIRNKAVLDVAAGVAGVALSAIAFVGAAYSAVTIALLVIACSGFGIWSFCYAKKHAYAFKEPKLIDQSNEPSFWSNLSNFVNHTEGLEKVAKLFNKVAEGAENIGIRALFSDSKAFVELHEVLNFPKRLYEWFVPDDKGEYFWSKESTTNWKVANKVFLTSLAVVTVASFLIKYTSLELAAIAAATVGGVPFLLLAGAVSFAAYTFCGFVDSAITMSKEYEKNPKDSKAVTKAKAWKVEEKLAKWRDISSQLSSNDEVKARLARATVVVSREKRAAKLKDAQDVTLMKQMELRKYADITISRLAARYKNACNRCNKAGINMLNDAPKTVGGTLFIASLYASSAIVAPIAAAAAALSFIGSFMGVVKVYKDTKYSIIHKEPQFPKARLSAVAA